MSTSRETYVVDASIVARWYLNNPPFLAQALQVRSDYDTNRIGLLAPDNLHYEVSGAIHRAVVAGFLRSTAGEAEIDRFLRHGITIIDADSLIIPAFRLSMRFGCSFYDSVYMALAEATNLRFLHADAALHRVLAGRFSHEFWIEDYPL